VTVHIPDSVRTALLDHAREGVPREVCGVLAGRRDEADCVERAIRTPNGADDPRRAYEIPPERLHRVITDVEASGDDVVGFYHSHPRGPPRPSETDRAAATWVDHLYVVVVPTQTPSVTAWRWTGDRFRETPVRRPDESDADEYTGGRKP